MTRPAGVGDDGIVLRIVREGAVDTVEEPTDSIERAARIAVAVAVAIAIAIAVTVAVTGIGRTSIRRIFGPCISITVAIAVTNIAIAIAVAIAIAGVTVAVAVTSHRASVVEVLAA